MLPAETARARRWRPVGAEARHHRRRLRGRDGAAFVVYKLTWARGDVGMHTVCMILTAFTSSWRHAGGADRVVVIYLVQKKKKAQLRPPIRTSRRPLRRRDLRS